jgi:hypothetical protein
MLKELCKKCWKQEIEQRFAQMRCAKSQLQERMEQHERVFDGWFAKLTPPYIKEAVPCLKTPLKAHVNRIQYWPLYVRQSWNYTQKVTCNYDFVTRAPINCPFLMEHMLYDQ